MEAVGQLTAGVAHDFNNLLAAIVGNTEIIEDKIGNDEEGKFHVDAVLQASDRAASLTDRLLAFSRQQALSPVATDVSELIGGIEDLLRRTLGETIDLRINVPTDIRPVMIDPHQFENALINLAINARDAMTTGGALTIETANVALDESYTDQEHEVVPCDYVTVAVSDTGSGMTPEVLDRVFEPFFTTKEVGKGSGLGLSMVFGFAKQSGGHEPIYSEVGHGSTIKLCLPCSPNEADRRDGNNEEIDRAHGSARILIVEDNENVRAVPVNILRNQGYQVVEANDGAEAIALLEDVQSFDLLFTDVVLPGGMNGVDIAERAKQIQPNIKVVYTTGYTETAAVHNGTLDATAVLISKPYRRAELLDKIQLVLADSET